MKTKLLIIIMCILFLSSFSHTVFASGCRGCFANTCGQVCCPYDTTCQCTDPGKEYNDCIDRCTYCEAFGNIGAR